MKKDKKSQAKKEQAKYERGQIFVKVVAGILAIMMVTAVAVSALYVLFS